MLFIALSLMLLSCSTPLTKKAVNITAERSLNAFQQSIIEKHNQLRRIHFDDSPLQYSLELQTMAQSHANTLAQSLMQMEPLQS